MPNSRECGMSKVKELRMYYEDELFKRAFNEWEVDKMLSEMSLSEIDELIKKIDAEKAERSKKDEGSTTTEGTSVHN